MSLVAIITRTKNRPLLLRRALDSVKNQSFKDFVWVIVNDAGAKEDVDKIAGLSISYGVNTVVIHRDLSIGMEAASNHGINSSSSKYIVIHDDDDTWAPDFLTQTVIYLEKNKSHQAVVTHSIRVDEVIEADNITEISRNPYNHWMMSVQFSEMIEKNQFPPISLLFRRSACEQLNGFDESLPVLGDWDFHLRMLLLGDIGVIPTELANYHFRNQSFNESDIAYGNTVTVGVSKHMEYDALYRNRCLRRDLSNNEMGLGHLLVIGRLNMATVHRLDGIERKFEYLKKIYQKIPFLKRFF